MGDPSEADISQRVGTPPPLVLRGTWPGTANVLSIGRCLQDAACTSDESALLKGPRSRVNLR